MRLFPLARPAYQARTCHAVVLPNARCATSVRGLRELRLQKRDSARDRDQNRRLSKPSRFGRSRRKRKIAVQEFSVPDFLPNQRSEYRAKKDASPLGSVIDWVVCSGCERKVNQLD